MFVSVELDIISGLFIYFCAIGGAGIPMYPGSQDQWGVNGAWSSIEGDSFL